MTGNQSELLPTAAPVDAGPVAGPLLEPGPAEAIELSDSATDSSSSKVEIVFPSPSPTHRGTVWVLHGFANSPWCTQVLCRRIEKAGYQVKNWGYPTWWKSIEEHAGRLAKEVEKSLESDHAGPVHFVGHSMGSIVARRALQQRTAWPTGRAVFLGPPNGGSDAAARWEPLVGRWLAPIRELSSRPGSYVRKLASLPGLEFGVIAARYDHVVDWRSTHLPYQTDHITVGCTHAGLLFRPDVADNVLHFLEHGRFLSLAASTAEETKQNSVVPAS